MRSMGGSGNLSSHRVHKDLAFTRRSVQLALQ